MTKNNFPTLVGVAAAGSQQALALQLGVTQQAVSLWLQQGYVPLMRTLRLEMIYGISRQRLISPKVRCLVDITTEGYL